MYMLGFACPLLLLVGIWAISTFWWTAAMNIAVEVCFWGPSFSYSGHIPWSRTAESSGNSMFNCGTTKPFSIVPVPFYISKCTRVSISPSSLPDTCHLLLPDLTPARLLWALFSAGLHLSSPEAARTLSQLSKDPPLLSSPLRNFPPTNPFALLDGYKAELSFLYLELSQISLPVSLNSLDTCCDSPEWSLPYHCDKCQNNFVLNNGWCHTGVLMHIFLMVRDEQLDGF